MTKYTRKLTQNILRRALTKLGHNGEHWTKGTYHIVEDGLDKYCAVGALSRSTTSSRLYNYAESALRTGDMKGYTSILGYNESAQHTFTDIRNLFNRAIKSLEKEIQ